MKYSHLIEQIYARPWLITPAGHQAIRTLVESRLYDLAASHESKRDATDICGDAVEVPQMTKADDIYTIPIGGIIGAGLSPIQRGYGAVDVEDISKELDQVVADPSTKGLILDFDSPGGTVAGVPELATQIAAIQESGKFPVYSFTRGQMCSAAYWLAAGSTAIYATASADVGSIGVYLPWVDQSKRYEMFGYRVELFKAGKLKGMGYPGTSLTKEQRQHLQDGVDEIYAMFTEHVTKHRTQVENDTMQGQSFLAGKAAQLGLVTGLVKDMEEVRPKILAAA